MSRAGEPQLGFVGTGTMGRPMAGHLLAAGHRLRVFDRAPAASAPLVEAGAELAASPAAAADGADVVFCSLPGPAEVREVVTGADGVLAAGRPPAVLVDLSTNAVDVVRELRERCAAAGVAFVDAPVSGGLARAEAGTLSVLVGGDDEDLEKVRPLLGCLGEQVFHVGPSGSGTVAKLVNNQLFLGAAALVQEAYLLASAAGLDPSDLHGVLKASSAGPYVALAPLLLGRAFDDVTFRLDIAAKDLDLAATTARDLGVDAPVTAAAARLYADAVEAGLGGQVFHATLRQLERRAGVEVPPLRRRSPTP